MISKTSIFEYMTGDHKRLDKIYSEFKKKKYESVKQAQELFKEFSKGLRQHITWEDEILFPYFEETTGMKESGPTVVMRSEHRQIEDLLLKIEAALQKENVKEIEQLETALEDVLSTHNDKEEGVLYPWMDTELDESTRRNILLELEGTKK